MRPYPNTRTIKTIDDVKRYLDTIANIRSNDISESSSLDGRFIRGRLRTDITTAPSSVTPGATDQVYDVYYDGNSLFILVNTGTAFEWRSVPLSSAFLRIGGTLNVNTTSVGNVGTGIDDLITYTIPAATLSVNGDNIEVTAWGTYAANGNNKNIKLIFGSTTVLDTGAVAANSGSWVIRATIVRTGATTQQCIASLVTDNTTQTDIAKYVTASETLANALVIKCTGEATSNNDIVQAGLKVFKSEV